MSFLKSLLTAFSYLVVTAILAYGYSGLFPNDDKQFFRGLLFTFIFVAVIPITLFFTLVYGQGMDATYFGEKSLSYVLILTFLWVGGIVKKLSESNS